MTSIRVVNEEGTEIPIKGKPTIPMSLQVQLQHAHFPFEDQYVVRHLAIGPLIIPTPGWYDVVLWVHNVGEVRYPIRFGNSEGGVNLDPSAGT